MSPKAGEMSWSGVEAIGLLEFPCPIFLLFANVYWSYEYGLCFILVEAQLWRRYLLSTNVIFNSETLIEKMKSSDKYRYEWGNLTLRHRIWYWMASVINETVEMNNNYFHGYAQTIFSWHNIWHEFQLNFHHCDYSYLPEKGMPIYFVIFFSCSPGNECKPFRPYTWHVWIKRGALRHWW